MHNTMQFFLIRENPPPPPPKKTKKQKQTNKKKNIHTITVVQIFSEITQMVDCSKRSIVCVKVSEVNFASSI